MENQQILTKQIQIIDLKPQFIQAIGKNKYKIKGNDGITYECWSEAWYSTLRLGQFITINYTVTSNQAKDGRIYTNYNIVLPKGPGVQPVMSQNAPQVNQIEKRIMDRLQIMENNIIEAIRMHYGDNLKLDENDVPQDLNTELQQVNEIPVIQEGQDGSYEGRLNNPF